MRKITIVLMGMFLMLASSTFAANCPSSAKLVIADEVVCAQGITTLTVQGAKATDYGFKWKVPNGKIISGWGTPEIQVSWDIEGLQNATVVYYDSDNCEIKGTLDVTIYEIPTVGGVSVADDKLCEGEKIVVTNAANPKLSTNPKNVYSVIGWTLNETPVDFKKFETTRYDDGKVVRFEYSSSVSTCPNVRSNPVKIRVEEKPLITSLKINNGYTQPDVVKEGSTVKFEVEAVTGFVPVPADNYKWYLKDSLVGKGTTLNLVANASTFNKEIKVKVSNVCGTTESNKTIYSITESDQTLTNDNFHTRFLSPETFVVGSNVESKAIDPEFKYWESDDYVFLTQNESKYRALAGQTLWFKRLADGTWEEHATEVEGSYPFKVYMAQTKPALFLETHWFGNNSRTFLLDKGEWNHTFSANYLKLYDPQTGAAINTPVTNYFDVSTVLNNGAGNAFASDAALAINGIWVISDKPAWSLGMPNNENKKVFGINQKDVIVKLNPGPTPNPNYNIDISIHNGAAENLVFDLGNFKTTWGWGIGIEHAGGAFIVKNLTIKNLGTPIYSNTSHPAFSIVSFYNFSTDDYKGRHIENIKIENCAPLVSTDKVLASAFGIDYVQNTYIKNLTSDVEHGSNTFDLLFHDAYPVTSRASVVDHYDNNAIAANITVDGISTTENKMAVYRRNGVFDKIADVNATGKYRYLTFSTNTTKNPEKDSVRLIEYGNEIPAYKTNSILYDRNDGYFVVYSSENTKNQFNVLKAFYKTFPVQKGAPKPNFKLVAKDDSIGGFEVPSFDFNEDINIVVVKNPSDVASQGKNSFVPYRQEYETTFLGGIQPKKIIVQEQWGFVNIYNIDFSSIGYATEDILEYSSGLYLGSLFNSKMRDFLPGDYLRINQFLTGIEPTASSRPVTVYPNPIVNEVNIKADAAITSVKVTDMSGRQIYTQGAAGTTLTIPASSWTNGTYIITVETQNGKGFYKIVK